MGDGPLAGVLAIIHAGSASALARTDGLAGKALEAVAVPLVGGDGAVEASGERAFARQGVVGQGAQLRLQQVQFAGGCFDARARVGKRQVHARARVAACTRLLRRLLLRDLLLLRDRLLRQRACLGGLPLQRFPCCRPPLPRARQLGSGEWKGL